MPTSTGAPLNLSMFATGEHNWGEAMDVNIQSINDAIGALQSQVNLPSGAANLVVATPNGSFGISSLRVLVAADIPSLPESKITNLTTDLAALAVSIAAVAASVPTLTSQLTNNSGFLSSVSFPLFASDGSNTAPTYSFASDHALGMYYASGYATFASHSDGGGIMIQADAGGATSSALVIQKTGVTGHAVFGMAGFANDFFGTTVAGDVVLLSTVSGSRILFNNNVVSLGNFSSAGHVLFSTDNSKDVGASGATRPRTVYAGTSMLAPLFNAATGFQVAGAATSGNVLRGNGTNFVSTQLAEADLGFTDITTNNASTSKHGFVPKLPNDASKFLDGTGAFSSPSGSGTVTSVALTVPSFLSVSGSPITGSGTLAVTLANENANTSLMGPTSGGAAIPAFRTLVADDYVTMVGDSGSGGTKGAAPAPSSGDAAAGKFLKADGTWTAPSVAAATNSASYLFLPWLTPAGMNSGGSKIVNAANEVDVVEFSVPLSFTFLSLSMKHQTTAAGTSGIGLYDASGNRLGYATFNSGSGTYQTSALAGGGSLTLTGGTKYYLAQTCTSATPTAYVWNFSTVAALTIWLNDGSNKRFSTAANASSVGVPPATLGALTAQANVFPIFTMAE